jgi:hypothetical protein
VNNSTLRCTPTNYSAFKEFVYAELRKQFQCGPLPDDKDLKTLAAEANAQPLESFIGELEQAKKRP